MKSRLESKQETQKRIRRAVAQLIHEVGYENIKIRDICKAADISIGTFYNYYATKEDILISAMDRGSAQTENVIQPQLTSESAVENLITYLKLQFQMIYDLPIAVQTEIMRMFLYKKGNVILDNSSINYSLIYEMVEQGIKQKEITSALTCEELTTFILKTIIGNCFFWCMNDGNFEIETTIVKEVESLLGIKN